MCGHPSQGSTPPKPGPGGSGSLTPPSTQDKVKPQVVITSPSNNAKIQSCHTTVKANITDAGGIKHATVRVDGAPRGTVTKAPFTFMINLSLGNHTIVVEAMDKAGNLGKATVKITATSAPPATPKPSPAPTPKPPGNSGGSSSGGNTPAPQGVYGNTCTEWSDCKSGMCAHDASLQRSYCTKTCAPSSGTACPAGSTCLGSMGGAYVCAPDIPDSALNGLASGHIASGCSMGAHGTPATPLVLLPLLALLALVIRRPR